ncbi:GNAT family N-acetyltransferase [Metasolibacillus meyeri]|uniref:GNAT family N-acetyltransferase n=1 Tax=Metasolibacillus meyeri TaxID=1071052 RepID=UPI001EE6B93B|nr:GNAT family N-acetyltransferase [Metasolibacillus meyeri]
MIHIQHVEEKDYWQIHRLRDYCFPNKYNEARRKDFHHWVQHSTTLGAYDGNKVVGQVLVLPLNMTIHRQNYKMGGIAFVASYPEYRQQGIAKKLMIESLKQMRANGQTVSVLAPFSVSFYRYFGWELFFEKLNYTIPLEKFPALGKKVDTVKRTSFEWLDEELFQQVKDFHNASALVTSGSMVRDDAWWNRLASRQPNSHFALYYDEGEVAAYLRYEIAGTTFLIHDFVTKDLSAEQAMWRYVTAHAASITEIKGVTANDSRFGYYFAEPQFTREVVQDMMVRIVDAQAFMQQYEWNKIIKPLYVRLEDQFCTWNEQLFEINCDGEVAIVETGAIDNSNVLTLPINLFSAMMVGYLSVQDAVMYAQQFLKQEVIENWQQALQMGKPEFYEYF